MKISILFLLLSLSLVPTAMAKKGPTDYKMITGFGRYKPGQFPTYFKTWPFQRGKAKGVYQVKKEGNNLYLSAFDDKNLSTQIYKEFHWKTKYYPYLKWRWRATALPAGARETSGATNDSACGVYILFGKTTRVALKYVWSTTLNPGTVYEKKSGKMIIKVLDSGSGNKGQWRWHSVDVRKDFETLIKRKMDREPTGFAILTDGNAVKKPAGCDYDDFHISAKP